MEFSRVWTDFDLFSVLVVLLKMAFIGRRLTVNTNHCASQQVSCINTFYVTLYNN